jgi:hypothetical protein
MLTKGNGAHNFISREHKGKDEQIENTVPVS